MYKRIPNYDGAITRHPIYARWRSMIQRCYNPKSQRYKSYGGRGITVCDEWRNSSYTFIIWALNNGYEKGLSIDRIDNNGPYAPSNCHWTSLTENNRNKQSTLFITAFGETKRLAEWAEDPRCKVSRRLLRLRIFKLGWPIDTAILTPAGVHR
jgi:hypothetical protein